MNILENENRAASRVSVRKVAGIYVHNKTTSPYSFNFFSLAGAADKIFNEAYGLKNKTCMRKYRSDATVDLVVLNGEVAVPCNLQSAIAGLIACARQIMSAVLILSSVEASIFRNNFAPNPVRPGREQR